MPRQLQQGWGWRHPTMPGEGKTTVSVNLALSLARKGARVILVDADLRRPSVKAALGIREPSQGLIDAAALDDPAQSASLLASVEGSTLRLLAGDTPRKDARQAPVRKIFRVIDFLRTQADYIILDTPPCGLLADSVSLARAADCAIYVLGAGAAEVFKPALTVGMGIEIQADVYHGKVCRLKAAQHGVTFTAVHMLAPL